MQSIVLSGLIIISVATATAADAPITLTSLLGEMADRDNPARLPSPRFRCLQASSYDRAQTDPANPHTWFANKDYEQFIRVENNEGRREWVIMEHQGAGAVVRFWIPLLKAKEGQMIRFYFDGEKSPAVAVKFNELLSGRGFVKPPLAFVASDEKRTEGVAGDMYLPIPFAKACKITLDQPPFYYIINYRAYDPGTVVKTFTTADFEAAAKPIDDFAAAQTRSASDAAGDEIAKAETLEPGRELTVDLPRGGRAVRRLELRIDPKDAPQALRSLVLTARFDGEPAVWCPIGEFFGCGVRLAPVADARRSVTEDGLLTACWTMPYRETAEIAVRNVGQSSLSVKARLVAGPWAWDDRSMHFHATWRRQAGIETRRANGTADWNYLEAQGQGVYVGDTLTVFSPSPQWYGEGDERVYVDGERFPSHLGTGTEDYYGYAWGMARHFSSPFLSMPRRDGSTREDWRGYTTTSRIRLLDGIPWQRSLKLDMEIWDWAATRLDYAVGAFWYARPGSSSNRPPMPAEAAAPVLELPTRKIAGAAECERLTVAGKSEGLAVETQSNVLEWSGETQLFVRGNKTGDYVELQVPAANDRPKKLTLYATKSYDYGILRFSVNGQPAGQDYDAYSPAPRLSGPIELGTFEPRQGQFVLRVEVVGANPAARGSKSYFGLDAIRAE